MRATLKKVLFGIKNNKGRKDIKNLKGYLKYESISIICSGPSAKYLKSEIKNDRIFCCNFSPKFLSANNTTIDVYITTSRAIEEGLELQEILDRFHIKNLIIDSKESLELFDLKNVSRVFEYDSRDNYLVRELLSIDLDSKIKKQKGDLRQVSHISSGMQLIQYALFSGSKNIKTIGLDMTNEVTYGEGLSYEVDPTIKVNRHLIADKTFLNRSLEKFKDVTFGKIKT